MALIEPIVLVLIKICSRGDFMGNDRKVSIQKREKIIANVKATLSIEGLELLDDESNLIKKYLDGELSEDEILRVINKGVE